MSQCLFSAVYSLKLLGSLGKTETSLRSLNLSLFYHKFLSYDKKRFNVFIALKDLPTIIMVTAQYHRHLKGCLSRKLVYKKQNDIKRKLQNLQLI